jgi:hypothetical protein
MGVRRLAALDRETTEGIDSREVLRRAWRIIWRHKVLWFFNSLPVAPTIVFVALIFYLILSEDVAERIPQYLSNPRFIALSFFILLLTAAVSLLLQVFSKSATTYGVLQIEAGDGRSAFREISKGGRDFFWRTLVVMLLTGVGAMVVFAVLSACLSLVGFATLGLGALIGQLVFLPATLFIYAVTEESQVAMVADGMKPMESITGAWELVKNHIEAFAVVTSILYFGFSILSSLAMLPVMLPLLIAVLGRFSAEFSNPSLLWGAAVFFLAFLPLSVALQAGAMLYVKTVFVITYLRLRRSPNLQPLAATRASRIVKEST